MTPEEKAASEAIEKKLNEISEANTLKADKEALNVLAKDLKELTEKQATIKDEAVKAAQAEVETLRKTVVEQGEKITKFSDFGGLDSLTVGDMASEVIKQFRSEHDKIISTTKGKQAFTLEVKEANIVRKDAATMARANYSGGVVGLSSFEPGITNVQRRRPYLRTLIDSGNIDNWYATWVEAQAHDPGAAGMTAEGNAKTLTDFDLVERKQQVEKVTAYVRITQEALEDIADLENLIRTDLVEQVELKLDSQIFSGDGNTPNLKGITTFATAYSVPAGFANEIPYANRFDVIQACVTQSQVANFNPDTVLLNPLDYGLMNITKAPASGDYARPFVFNTASGINVAGCDVYVNNGVTADKVVVMEAKKSHLRIRKELTLTIKPSADATDEKNLWVIVAEMRAVHYIKTNHAGAFIYADVTDAMAGLNDSTPLT